MRALLLMSALVGCADVTSPDDGLDLGPVTQVKDWFTSVYVARAPEGVVLFDAGFREGAMKRGLADLDITPEQVDHIVLTHGHSDHVGALDLYPSATVWALEAEFDEVREHADREPDEALPSSGEVVLAGLSFEVFAVPGHTAGTAVYLVDGVLLLGDTGLQSRDGELIPVNPKRSADPAASDQNLRELADRLDADRVDWLAPSHSAPIRGFGALEAF